ncbi:MAG TPA: ClcB-like voltage-gated chloride channel protein [Verrucomicrobiae bacterium]|jgi:CIC family chloride channel protein|nr:ClcB-like voltage-gated chloride channel protein [Verrucomicrobiae bacterium]
MTWRGTFEAFMDRSRRYARRNWQRALRIRERLSLSEEALHLLMAGVVGLMGGVINVLFYLSIEKVQFLLVGHHYPGQNIVQIAHDMSWPLRLIMPAIGGLLAASVLFWGLRLAGKQRSTNLLEVVVAGDGRLPLRSGVVRAVSSLMSIGTGASIGREGGITQLSATAASKWGQLVHWQPYRLRLLVACGAAAGMAAAYNAPITGAIFAAHIVLGNFSMAMFAPLLCSSVVASMLSRSFFGLERWYDVPNFDFTSIVQLPWFVILGFFAGVLGAGFLKALSHSNELFKRIPALHVRMGLAGLAVGGIACFYPEVWGNGYVETSAMLQHPIEFWSLLGIFGFKLIATVITVGSGAVGGVITPTLFLGAALGSLIGEALQHGGLAPAHLPIGIFALVGMGSVFAATTRSPLLAIVMILEISLNYSIMPALMLGCAVSTLVSRRLHPNSVYTESLKLRSLEVESYRLGAATEQTIGDLMRAPVQPVRENTPFPEIADRFLANSNNFLPVVDAQQRLLGMVALLDLKEYLGAGDELTAIIAYDVMRPAPPCLRPGQKLLDALPTLLASEMRNVPVVNTFEENRLIGSVPRAEALAALSEAIASSVGTTTSTEAIPKEKPDHPPPAPAPKSAPPP